MSDFYLLTNRKVTSTAFSEKFIDPDFFVRVYEMSSSDQEISPRVLTRIDADKKFITRLTSEAEKLAEGKNHAPMCLAFIHGYNNGIQASVSRAWQIKKELNKLDVWPVVVAFSWPSDAQLTSYLQDRTDANISSHSVVKILARLKEARAFDDCRINLAVLAHSMGNRVLREGLKEFSKTLGYPADFPIFSETIMVAPDIESDSLTVAGSGFAINALSRRVTVYYNRNDDVLAGSQYLKNSFSARLGRNGPNSWSDLHTKAVAVDCSTAIPKAGGLFSGINGIHSAYFEKPRFFEDLSQTLRSIDREEISTRTPILHNGKSSFQLKSVM